MRYNALAQPQARRSDSEGGTVGLERVVGQYVTQPGETLMGIAARELRAGNRWRDVAALNAARWPDMGPHDCYPPGSHILMPNAG